MVYFEPGSSIEYGALKSHTLPSGFKMNREAWIALAVAVMFLAISITSQSPPLASLKAEEATLIKRQENTSNTKFTFLTSSGAEASCFSSAKGGCRLHKLQDGVSKCTVWYGENAVFQAACDGKTLFSVERAQSRTRWLSAIVALVFLLLAIYKVRRPPVKPVKADGLQP